MRFESEILGLPSGTETLLKELIHERTGLVFDSGKVDIMNALSVGETYFWREIDQVRALTQTIVPHWFATHPGKTMRIWSAACATGEEPLTIAIALHEAGWFDRA